MGNGHKLKLGCKEEIVERISTHKWRATVFLFKIVGNIVPFLKLFHTQQLPNYVVLVSDNFQNFEEVCLNPDIGFLVRLWFFLIDLDYEFI